MTTSNSTLAQLAITVPAASRVFRRYGLDYCCGGKRSLAEVCDERSLDVTEVLAELERESAAPEPVLSLVDRSDAELIDHVVERYHDSLRVELPELLAMARRVEIRHADKATVPRGLADHLAQVTAELTQHLDKEERILFPLLKSGAGRGASGPIHVMMNEHDDHGAALRQIRALTTDLAPPTGACTTWRALYLRLEELEADLMEHIHIENNILFPEAARMEAELLDRARPHA
jgi:regulator of cell morphogenesis and NO signaling